jgi:DNA repair protein RadC
MDGARNFDEGIAALGEHELLAAVLDGGRASRAVADRLLENGLASLRSLRAEELRREHGLREDRARRLVAALELGRRAVLAEAPERMRLLHPGQLVQRLWPRLAHLRHEEFWVLLLSARHEELRAVRLSAGGLSVCSVLPREAFAPALIHGASAVAFAHNHPSGDPTPSGEDLRLQLDAEDARALLEHVLEEGARILGIELVDHLVVAERGAHSAHGGFLPRPSKAGAPPVGPFA